MIIHHRSPLILWKKGGGSVTINIFRVQASESNAIDAYNRKVQNMNRRKFIKEAGVFSGLTVLPAASVFSAAANSKVQLGLIGCGGRGRWLASIYEKQTNSKVAAVHDVFEDRMQQAAKQYKVPGKKCFKGLGGYKDLFKEKVEAVLIASPPFAHPKQGLEAVEAGKHVLMAKPVAVDVPGCKTVQRSAEKAKGRLSFWVDFQTRADKTYQEAVKRIRDGAIGFPVSGQVFYVAGRLGSQARPNASAWENRLRNWVFDKALSGDIIVEQNIHVIDVANWILGAAPLAAYGTGGRKARTDVGDCWDHFLVTFYYPNDVRIDFCSGQYLKGYSDLCARIYGNKGTVDTHYSGQVSITGDHAWPGKNTKGLYYSGALNNARDFITSIERGRPVNNGAEAAKSTQSCVLARVAAYGQKEVTWEEVDKANEEVDLRLEK